MSKRRINKQQADRIKKIQQRYQAEHVDEEILANALVITRFSKQVEIEDEQGLRRRCNIRPHLETLVAGDRIVWQSEGEQQGVVVSLYPRQSVLAKKNAHGQLKPVAANISQLVIVFAPKPEVSWPLIDSYLVMASLLKLKAILVLNKCDLKGDEIKQQLDQHYQHLNYAYCFTSHHSPESIEALQQLLKDEISVFVGQSGVGKSSLIASLLPHEENISTGALSEISELGRHTTSNSTYYHIPTGGALIDSPGVREFNLEQMQIGNLAQHYIEFQPLLSQCKFRNCTHQNTPGCAILQAIQEGKISTFRYENFLKLSMQYQQK